MSAGTRWFCVMKRKTVTVNTHVWGSHPLAPQHPPHPVGKEQPKTAASFKCLPLSGRLGDLFCFESEKSCMLLLRP